MLKEHTSWGKDRPAARIPEHRLWHDERRNTHSLGCGNCPEVNLCGGMAVAAGLMNCLDLCCGQPELCDKPCRSNPDFAMRVREVGGFFLDNVPRATPLPRLELPLVVPVLFHGKRRSQLVGPEPVALPLYAMFKRRNGVLRFASHEKLCAAFGLIPGTPIILTGTDQDPPLERWWGYESKRREIIGGLKTLGIALTTTPNFSVFVDVPRHVDLHAIKRIALVHWEFLDVGLPAALHVNGRTDSDFRRWGAYVRERPEITHLAYEFTTGTGRAARRNLYADWLVSVASAAGRPLDLILRGGVDLLPRVAPAFNSVTVLDTTSFMKTMKRRRALSRANASPTWQSAPSAIGEPVDALFAWDRSTVQRWIESQIAAETRPAKAAVAGR